VRGLATDPEGARRWPFRHIAWVLAVTAFGAGIPTPLYALYEQRYHFTSGVLAVVFAAYTAGVLATMLLSRRSRTSSDGSRSSTSVWR